MAAKGKKEVAGPDGLTLSTRLFGWVNLAIMAVFLLNNFLTYGAGLPGAAFVSPATGGLAWLQFAFYPIAIGLALYYVVTSRDTPLRVDAEKITAFNTWFIRAAFWAVAIIGIADMAISFLRVEGLLASVVGTDLERELGKSQFRGPWVHMPLLLLSAAIACFTRTLGFTWLALMIVVAELLIVFARFIFSYEQAFMADLVRFWYGALFLFASAYTLLEDGHVRVDLFYAGFKTRFKGLVNGVGSLTMGIVFCWTILIVGMGGQASIINSPLFNFEVTQAGFGMYVKYMMAGFLGVFAISMMIEFVAYIMSAVADWRGDPGHVEHEHPVTA